MIRMHNQNMEIKSCKQIKSCNSKHANQIMETNQNMQTNRIVQFKTHAIRKKSNQNSHSTNTKYMQSNTDTKFDQVKKTMHFHRRHAIKRSSLSFFIAAKLLSHWNHSLESSLRTQDLLSYSSNDAFSQSANATTHPPLDGRRILRNMENQNEHAKNPQTKKPPKHTNPKNNANKFQQLPDHQPEVKIHLDMYIYIYETNTNLQNYTSNLLLQLCNLFILGQQEVCELLKQNQKQTMRNVKEIVNADAVLTAR